MKVVILAGGLGTRLQEETTVKPKPMVEIGGRPILWHIMKVYAAYGYKEFIIALGYKGEIIKEYFLNYYNLRNDVSIHLGNGGAVVHGGAGVHEESREDWTVHLVDTGSRSQTGGRVRRLRKWIDDETFLMTYGDGVSNINIRKLVSYHRAQGRLATLTAVRPPARFGTVSLDGDLVTNFVEKAQASEGWINGGFFVLEPKVLDYIAGDDTEWEREPLETLAAEGQLGAYKHPDFWHSMDTLRDVRSLEGMWEKGNAPWKVWEG